MYGHTMSHYICGSKQSVTLAWVGTNNHAVCVYGPHIPNNPILTAY